MTALSVALATTSRPLVSTTVFHAGFDHDVVTALNRWDDDVIVFHEGLFGSPRPGSQPVNRWAATL
jgi:hypothetical protein